MSSLGFLWRRPERVVSAAGVLWPGDSGSHPQAGTAKPHARFGSLLRALRCKDCGKQLQRLVLTDNLADRFHGTGASGGWQIEVMLPITLDR
jgi:hypothetical protein